MDARNTPLQKLEMEAYTAVLRALAATHMNWVRHRLPGADSSAASCRGAASWNRPGIGTDAVDIIGAFLRRTRRS